MADTAINLSDLFGVRIGDHVEVTACAGADAMNRFFIPLLVYIAARKTLLPVAGKAV
ncbi:MAG: hypothetical protein P8Z71_02915 [Candidatus Sulfobium sp.]